MSNKLLAPNGKPSNLNTTQYELVRTPAFKKWFGDWENDPANASKVVDENGEPMVVYHNSNIEFNVFELKGLSDGFFFTKNIEDEEFSQKGWLKSIGLTYEQAIKKGYDLKYEKAKPYFLNIKQFFTKSNVKKEYWSTPYFENSVIEFSKRNKKNDGVEFLREMDNKQIIVAFEPNQIKIADGTNTTFDSRNDDIRFDNGGRTIAQTPAPKKDQVKGSDINKKSSSKDLSSAKLIKFDDKTLDAIKNKVKEHNGEHPDKKINLSSAKAVVRRGMGAYSKSHRPTISGGKPNSRVAWGLARLNAFTYKIVNGKSKSGKYSQDDDLIDELGYKVANYENGGKMKDIRCINCGWEWNRKDSELWDMYVCHKCGFDNTSFYTSDGINRLLKGGRLNSNNGVTPNYLKMFLDL